MAFGGNQVNILITATDRASAKMAAVSRSAGGLAGSMSALKMPALLAAGATIAVGVAATKTAMAFNKDFGQVATLLDGMTRHELEDMRKQLFEISNTIAFDVNQGVRGLYQAISAGIPKDNIFDFMKTAMETAKAGDMEKELGTVIKIMAAALKNYDMAAGDAEKVSDILFNTIKGGVTTMGELSQSLADVLPLAAASSISFEEVGAMMAVMTQQSTNTSKSVTALRALLAELSRPTTKLSQALRDNVGAFEDLAEEGVPVAVMLDRLRGKVGDVEFKALFGSVEAMAGALQMTGANLPSITSAMGDMEEAAGSMQTALQKVNETMGQELADALIIAQNKWTEFSLQVLPYVVVLLDKLIDLIDAMQKFNKMDVDWLPDWAKAYIRNLAEINKLAGGPGGDWGIESGIEITGARVRERLQKDATRRRTSLARRTIGQEGMESAANAMFGIPGLGLGTLSGESPLSTTANVENFVREAFSNAEQRRQAEIATILDPAVIEKVRAKLVDAVSSELPTWNRAVADGAKTVDGMRKSIKEFIDQIAEEAKELPGSWSSAVSHLQNILGELLGEAETAANNMSGALDLAAEKGVNAADALDKWQDELIRLQGEISTIQESWADRIVNAIDIQTKLIAEDLELQYQKSAIQASLINAAASGKGPIAFTAADYAIEANLATANALLNMRNAQGQALNVAIIKAGELMQRGGYQVGVTPAVGRVGTHQIGANQYVTINVAGEIFMTDETGQRMSDLLNKIAASNGAATLSDLALGQT